jgi:predicted nucleic acid-binding protein
VSVRFPGQHERVLIDTSVWIYHFEQHPQLGLPAGKVIEALEAGKFRGVASELTLLELTVRPLQLGRQDVADDYEVLLDHFPNLELEPISREILLQAAGLRARHRLRTPDAIQIATGLRTGATLAVTNDEAWRNLGFIQTVILSDLVDSG